MASRAAEADFILVTNDSNQPYIYALICEPIPPKALAADPMVLAPGPAGFSQVVRVGKYDFMPRKPDDFPESQRLFEEAWRRVPRGATGFVIENPGHFKDGKVEATFTPRVQAPWAVAYEVRRWTKQ